MSEWPIDWRAVVDEAIRRRKSEGLSQRALAELAGVSTPTVNAFEQGEIRLRLERVIAILEALDLFVKPSAPDSFGAFRHGARRRWAELVAPLESDHPSRQPLGHSEQCYALEGLGGRVSARELRSMLGGIPVTSGWSPFWVPSRTDLRPVIEDGVVECWLGRPEVHRVFTDPAHSDFWQVSPGGFAYLRRGFQEDGPDNLDPGSIFDLTLPIWRTAEVLLHAASLARALGASEATGIRLAARYEGLSGRTLVSWSQPLLRTVLDARHRARSSRVELAIAVDIAAVEHELEHVVRAFLEPLYERFDGYDLSLELVAAQLADLRRQPGFGDVRG